MPQLFTFLHCLNPKPRAITTQNNLWPLSTSLGLSPFLLFYKATASDWDGTKFTECIRAEGTSSSSPWVFL